MSTPKIIYLDQNKWVEILRAESHGGNTPATRAATSLREAVANGKAVVPLSASHYIETWHRSKWESRFGLASLMRDLSNYATLAPVQCVQRWEIESLLLPFLGLSHKAPPTPNPKDRVLARGVNHAFGSTTGRLRLVDSVASANAQEGETVEPSSDLLSILHQVRALPNDAYEWWSLAGDRHDSMIREGFDTRGQHRIGDVYAEQERALSQHLTENPQKRSKLDELIAAQELVDLSEDLHSFASGIGISPERIYGRLAEMGAPNSAMALLESLPSVSVRYTARRLKHRNSQWRWQQHDHVDMAALAVSIPYADVVVTERQWAHLFHVAKMDQKFRTKVVSQLGDLPALLER
ncbi:hypothetical protein [Streptomyces sp. NPDC007346]|uniref:hypothetical protein n=1 Tax=Streptomyces sp. NPDC007346 TaxID=3154682 RepID=UPI0034536320